jgi:hypothetical protein
LRIEQPHAQRVHYLTILGRYVTPNSTIVTGGAQTGPITSTVASDWLSTPNHRELALNFTVQAVSGSSPTLDIYLDVLDPVESQNSNVAAGNAPVASVKLTGTQIAQPLGLRAIITNGVAAVWQDNQVSVLGTFNVPMRWQVRFVVGGNNPSYSVLATYEARE